ncbi:BTB/POZ domain-containing protein 17-like [Amphiura filiformis]|uniref:BTB/POZ domain-containing protein 17-like n=1 Tax=Amphiura filiformis TaxID=82378 RepID=UPI003B225F46
MMASLTEEAAVATTVNCRNLIIDGLNRLFNDQATSDVTLLVGNKRFYVHKTILAASSEYFLRMFYGGQWMESTHKEIVLHETPACEDIFDSFIQYFYSGAVKLCLQTIPHLLLLADKYDAKVKCNCLEFMTETINRGNLKKALLWMPICDQIGAMDVLERCFFMVCLNFEKACKTSEWLSLPLHYVVAILKRSDIVVSSEYDVFDAVQSWILSQQDCQAEIIEELLSHIDFNRLDVSDLIHVEQSLLDNDVNTSDVIRTRLSRAFQQLAMAAENRRMQKTERTESPSRCYVNDKAITRVRLSNRYAFITPQCSKNMKLSSPDVLSSYTWILSYEQKRSTTTFMITVPKVSEEVPKQDSFDNHSNSYSIPKMEQRFLHNDVQGTVHIDVLVLLKNSQGVNCHIGKISKNTEMPQVNGGIVAECPLEQGAQNIPNECLVSFEISKP